MRVWYFHNPNNMYEKEKNTVLPFISHRIRVPQHAYWISSYFRWRALLFSRVQHIGIELKFVCRRRSLKVFTSHSISIFLVHANAWKSKSNLAKPVFRLDSNIDSWISYGLYLYLNTTFEIRMTLDASFITKAPFHSVFSWPITWIYEFHASRTRTSNQVRN